MSLQKPPHDHSEQLYLRFGEAHKAYSAQQGGLFLHKKPYVSSLIRPWLGYGLGGLITGGVEVRRWQPLSDVGWYETLARHCR